MHLRDYSHIRSTRYIICLVPITFSQQPLPKAARRVRSKSPKEAISLPTPRTVRSTSCTSACRACKQGRNLTAFKSGERRRALGQLQARQLLILCWLLLRPHQPICAVKSDRYQNRRATHTISQAQLLQLGSIAQRLSAAIAENADQRQARREWAFRTELHTHQFLPYRRHEHPTSTRLPN